MYLMGHKQVELWVDGKDDGKVGQRVDLVWMWVGEKAGQKVVWKIAL